MKYTERCCDDHYNIVAYRLAKRILSVKKGDFGTCDRCKQPATFLVTYEKE